MATPLAELLDTVLFDTRVREQFRQAPESFLRSAGYDELDAADVQEAMLVLADGSPPIRAGQLIAGGEAIGDPADLDDLDGAATAGLLGAAQGLVVALDAMPIEEHDDPATLDLDHGTAEPAGNSGDDSDHELELAFGAGTADDAIDEPLIDTDDPIEDVGGIDRPADLGADLAPDLHATPDPIDDPTTPLDDPDQDPFDEWDDYEG